MYSNLYSRTSGGQTVDLSADYIDSIKGTPDGLATLDENGVLKEEQIPDLAITDTFTATSQPTQLALSGVEKGDLCVRTDENKSYVCIKSYDGSQSVGTFTKYWQELLTPDDLVSSVAGRDGDVVLVTTDITDITASVDELNYCNGVTSNIQDQLDAKTTSVADDLTPKLGGDLDTNGHNIDLVTPTELSYLEGVTSNIQDQFDSIDSDTILGRTVVDTEIGDRRVLGYDIATDTIRYLAGGNVTADEEWTAAGDLVVGKKSGEGVILNSSGTNDDVLVVDSTQISGLNWKSLSALTGVENDLLWDAKGDLAVGVGINKSINLSSGTTGQILSVDSTKITGLAWVDENTIATDPIWDTGAKGSLAVKYSYLPEGAEKPVIGVTLLPVGANDYILTADSSEISGLKWKELSTVFNILTDDNWTAKGELVVGTGENTATIVTAGTDNQILTSNSATSSGVEWVDPTAVFAAIPVSVVRYDDIWTTAGDIIYADGSIEGVRLPIGSENDVLHVSSAGLPSWEPLHITENTDWTSAGDLIVGDGVDSASILSIGENGQVLVVDTSEDLNIAWKNIASVFNIATDPIWDNAGDLVVADGYNSAIKLAKGSENQILSVKSGEVAWSDLPDTIIESDTAWTTKGDIAVASGNGIAAILPLGTQGETLIVDTNKPLGLKWANAQTGNSVVYDLIWEAKGDIAVATTEGEASVLPIGSDGYVLSVDADADNYIGWREEIKSAPIWDIVGSVKEGLYSGVKEQVIVGKAYNQYIPGTPTGHWEEVRTARSLTAGTNGTCLMVNQSSTADYPTVRWDDPLRRSNIWSGRYNLLMGHSSNIYGDPDTRTAEILAIGDVDQQLTVKWHDGGEYGVSYKYLDYAYSPALTALTTKGDILIASSANTADRLAVGAENFVLTSDSSAPNGVSWKNVRDPLSILADDSWTTKGEIVVATGNNTASLLKKGDQGQVLSVDNIETSGLKWTTPSTLATDDLWYLPGDLAIGTGEGTAARFPASPNYGYVLISDPTDDDKLRWLDPKYIMSVVDDNVWDAVGDLVVGTGIDTCEKLSVGTDGQVLSADSLASGGISWKTIGTSSIDTDFTPNGDIESTNVQDAIVEVRDDTDTKLSNKVSDTDFNTHTSDITNPHQVSPSQVGNDTAQWNASKILGVSVDDTNKSDNYVLSYDTTFNKIEYREINSALMPDGTLGDIIYYDGTDWITLGKGLDTQVLKMDGDVPIWADESGGGGDTATDIKTITLGYDDFTNDTITLSYALPADSAIAVSGVKVNTAFDGSTTLEIVTEDNDVIHTGNVITGVTGNIRNPLSFPHMNMNSTSQSLKVNITGLGGGAWYTGNWNLNTARQGLAGCGTQTSALSFGGYAGSNSAVTEKFDGSSWSTDSGWNLNTARHELAGCGTQTSALSFGGYTGSNLAVTEKFDGSSWSTNSGWNLNTARHALAGCGTQTSALSFGGRVGSNSSVTEKFNGVSWSTDSGWNLNTARYWLAGCGTQTSALSFGGYTGTSSSVTEKFNGVSWSTDSGWNLNTARHYLAGCGTQTSALSFGGYAGSNSAVTEKFDGSSWSTDSGWNLNTARRELAGCGTQTSALSFGGYTDSNLAVTEKFDGSSWSTNSGWNLNTARHALAGCGTQTSALSFGGRVGSNSSVTEKFNGVSWSTDSGWNLNTARYWLAGCGTQTSALSFGGYVGSYSPVTEKFINFTDLSQGELTIKLVVIA